MWMKIQKDPITKTKNGLQPVESESIASMAFRHRLLKAYADLPIGGRVVVSNISAHINGDGDLRVGVGGDVFLFFETGPGRTFYVKGLCELVGGGGVSPN
jgi:hypothetical protein